MTRPCCPEAPTEATSLLNFPILRIGYLYDKGFYDINKQFSEGQLSVFLLLSHVFACCAVLLAVGKSNPRTREGCDSGVYIARLSNIEFQSTHP